MKTTKLEFSTAEVDCVGNALLAAKEALEGFGTEDAQLIKLVADALWTLRRRVAEAHTRQLAKRRGT
jgi:hypothetical protein